MAEKIEWHPNGTPGPWKVGPVDDTMVTTQDGSEVAAIDGDYNHPDTWPIMETNARAIAEVPAMVQALRALDAFWSEDGETPDDPSWTPQTREIWVSVRAILARIDGEA